MKINSIQFLRAIAALLVVYDHSMLLQSSFGTSRQQSFLHLSRFGGVGVDLFFVISGFIITFVANNYEGKSQGLYFLEKRFCRINPLYYLLTLLVFLINLLQNIQHISSSINNYLNSLVDSLLILPIKEDLNDHHILLISGWTLSFEWLFYLLFSFLIFFKVKHKIYSLIGIIILLVICGRIFKPTDFRLSLITNPILLEFLLGCIICNIYLTVKQIHILIGFSCLLIGIATFIYTLIYGFGDIWYFKAIYSGDQSINRFLLWGLPSCLTVAGCIFLEKNGRLSRIWNNKYALLCGDASYSVYLVHFIALKLLRLLFLKTGYFFAPDIMIWLQFFIAVAFSIWFYKLFEKRFLRYMYKKLDLEYTSTFKNALIN